MNKNEVLSGKRIFIGISNAGAQGVYSFTRILRSQGYQIDFYGSSVGREWLDVTYDSNIKLPSNRYLRLVKRFYLFFTLLFKYDIFHFNASTVVFFYKFDYLMLKLFRKMFVITFR